MSFNYPRDVRFRCQRCTTCCGDTETRVRHILLLRLEAERISREALKPIREIAVKIVGHEPDVFEMRKTAREGKCIFLAENQCMIYTLRPLVCRFYPFELKTAKNGTHKFGYTEECKGIGKGKQLDKTYFEDLFQLVNDQLSEGSNICK